VLAKLFHCRKTVLGDATQAVNPCSASNVELIRNALTSASCVQLTKSYRSTWEIMQFAPAISPNPELEAMKRHGEAVRVVVCEQPSDALMRIIAEIKDFQGSHHRALALIAKTQMQADTLHRSLIDAGVESRLLDANSAGFSIGVIVCTAHLAKGLEFDRVIVPDASAHHYHTEMDRNLHYVSCTRAMHRLSVFAVGEPSALLPASHAA
jgi:DNA helicase II / ATP-dependent DNA helicase PcrA